MFEWRKTETERMEAMVAQYGDRVYRFCYRLSRDPHEADDLTQEVFLAAFQGLGRFAGRASLSTWLYKIAVYRWRARRERHHRNDIPLDQAAEETVALRDPSAAHAERLAFEAALNALPDAQREAFLLTKSEGLSCRDAARVLGIPEGTLKFRVHQAVVRLRSELAPASAPQEVPHEV